jgi:sec-independent protein translocase protein TatA
VQRAAEILPASQLREGKNMFGLSFQELLIVAVVAVLLFGRNLPSVARSWGQMYKQFRSGLNDLQSQINMSELYDPAPAKPKSRRVSDDFDDRDEVSAPRFQPPPAEPQATDSEAA